MPCLIQQLLRWGKKGGEEAGCCATHGAGGGGGHLAPVGKALCCESGGERISCHNALRDALFAMGEVVKRRWVL